MVSYPLVFDLVRGHGHIEKHNSRGLFHDHNPISNQMRFIRDPKNVFELV